MQARWARQFGTDIPPDQRVNDAGEHSRQPGPAQLIEKRLEDPHYRVSDALVLAEVQSIPPFQVDGKYDPPIPLAPARPSRPVRNRISSRDAFGAADQPASAGHRRFRFLTRADSSACSTSRTKNAKCSSRVRGRQIRGQRAVDDAAIKAYYDKNGDRFMTTESVALEYAELRLEQLATQVAPTEADLQKLYEDNRAIYVLDERRRARHIVVAVTGDDDAAALKKAEDVAAEARAGKDFASSRRNIRATRPRPKAATWASSRRRISRADRRHAVRA